MIEEKKAIGLLTLDYPLAQGRTINRWLVSGIREEPVHFEPVTLHGDINLWLKKGFSVYDNPCRTAFVKERQKKEIQPADVLEDFPGGKASWMGQESQMRVFFPFDDVNLNLSAFWFVPTYLSAWATTLLESSKEQEKAQFEVRTCGGVSIWVNGKKVAAFAPFTRNIEHTYSFEASLLEGENRLEVFFDDLAERDTYFYFRLDYLGGEEMRQRVPMGTADPETVRQAEEALEDACFERDNYTAGTVRLCCRNPYPDREFILDFRGGTEENRQAGLITERHLVVPVGEEKVAFGESEELPFGFMSGSLSTVAEGIPISRTLTVENFPIALLPPKASDIQERKRQVMHFLAQYGEGNVNRAVALLYTGGDPKEIERILLRQIEGINARYDCSDFHLVYFAKIWTDFAQSGVLSQELLAKMKDCMLRFRYWMDEPGDDVMWFFSENHALVFHVCQRLIGELFPDEIFQNSGMTGRQMAEKAKGLLMEWFEQFNRDGFTEWNSAAYLPIDSLGLSNLYAQTNDPELRKMAKDGLDFIFYLLAVASKDGYLACSAGRTYHKELMGNYCNAPSAMSYVGYGLGNITPAAKGVVSLCFCDYEPPKEYMHYLSLQEDEEFLFKATQGYEKHVNICIYKTASYSLTTADDFRPGNPGYQEHVLHLVFGPACQAWVNHPGELCTHGHARPSYWAGNGSLPRVNQYKGYASMSYDIPQDHPVSFTHLYLPAAEYDEIQENGNWIYLRKGDGYAAIYAACGLKVQKKGPNQYREYLSEGRKNIWLWRAGDRMEFGSFESFIRKMEAAKLKVEIAQLYAEFDDPFYGQMCSGMQETLTVDGKVQQYADYPLRGELEIKHRADAK